MDRLLELKHYKKIHGLDQKVSLKEERLLKTNMPLQKIVGFINYDNLIINVQEKVLIPRYETEEVIHKALQFLTPLSKVLDLGCGSGYIGLTIKQKINCDVTLSDIDDNAIKQTTLNAQLNNLHVKIIKSNLFEQIDQKYDLIISNLPYIPNNTILDASVLNFEPHHALFGGIDGNDFFRAIIKNINLYLKKSGVLILEMSSDNYSFLISHGFLIENDINDKPRIAIKHF